MASVLVRVADGIAEELSQGTFNGVPLTAVRSYADIQSKLERLGDGVHIDVVPVRIPVADLDDRWTYHYRVEVQIIVRRKFNTTHLDEEGQVLVEAVDGMVELMEAIHEFLVNAKSDTIGRRLASYPEAVWAESKIPVPVDIDLLRKIHLFAGMITVTYDVPKSDEESVGTGTDVTG